MRSAPIRSILARVATALWVTAVLFLVLAFPAHRVIETESGALLLQAGIAGAGGAAFAFQRALEQALARVLALVKRSSDGGAAISSIQVDA